KAREARRNVMMSFHRGCCVAWQRKIGFGRAYPTIGRCAVPQVTVQNAIDGCARRASRKPQRYPEVSRGLSTRSWVRGRDFMCRYLRGSALTAAKVAVLAPCFIDDHGDRIGQVEAAVVGPHRQADAL